MAHTTRFLWLVLALLSLACSGGAFSAPLFGIAGAAGMAGLPDAVAGSGGQVAAAGADGLGGSAGTPSSAAGSAGTTGGTTGGTGGTTGGTGGTTGGTGGTTGGTGGTTGGTGGTCQITAALSAALPERFTWQSFGSNVNTGSGIACAKCTSTPCGDIPVTWGQPVQSDASTILVPVQTATVCVPGLYGACPPTAGCTLCMTSTSGLIVTLKIAPSGDGYVVQSATVGGSWVPSGCSYATADAATTSANSSLVQALTGLRIAC